MNARLLAPRRLCSPPARGLRVAGPLPFAGAAAGRAGGLDRGAGACRAGGRGRRRRCAARIAALIAEARDGDRAFDADLPAAERATAHVGRRGIGQLDRGAAGDLAARGRARRGPTRRAAELHQLRLARAGQPTSAADLAALDAAIEEVGALAERQQQRWTGSAGAQTRLQALSAAAWRLASST